MFKLFISTSMEIKNILNKKALRKITNLSDNDIKKILDSLLDFPIMIPNSEDDDNKFINKYQCVVIFNNILDDIKNDKLNNIRILNVTKTEKTLFLI